MGAAAFGAEAAGYRQLVGWLESWGSVARVGMEGAGSCCAGLARPLAVAGIKVVEVNRPNRQMRWHKGKTDAVDAEAAARAALSGQASAVPKAANGPVDAIRMLRWSAPVEQAVGHRFRLMKSLNIGTVNAITSWAGEKHSPRLISESRIAETC